MTERGVLAVSDDTQLTLATCESIVQREGVDPAHIAATFRSWFRRRMFTGLGASTLKALRDLDAGNHWALSGASGERSAGNGAAMRIAPLAFLLDPRDRRDRVTIRDVCRITHHSDEAYIGALAILHATHCVTWPSGIFPELGGLLPDSRIRNRFAEFALLPDDTSVSNAAIRFGSSGYVVETVPLALLLAQRMTVGNLAACLEELVRVSGDTDTIGSIAGHVAGAHLGLSRLPESLCGLDALREVIPRAESFARWVGARASGGESTGELLRL